ncbi:hypothetical protein J0871_16840 [Salegentibacter sp. BDJ18]|uniref:hypothetical protein n=1 Tax=Salegentibacter sp. BDJ18 TaxID=2816376 RepID=UPI001AAE3031|nr:hypothetical protein [Salegentibacter sp. BDJ18]MBO2546085.1 hypothetical protein [Salegentibacter sp. BDJ18]
MTWYQSRNNYFQKPAITHKLNRGKIKYYLEQIKGYSQTQANIYLAAYDYFVRNPEQFDGATKTEDLYDLEGLELAAMLHDWLYIYLNASASYKYTWYADKLMRSEMRRMHKSSWNTGARFVLLLLKSIAGFPMYCRFIKKRKMSLQDKMDFEKIYAILRHQYFKKPWHKEFKGELTWCAIFLIVFTLIFI